MPPTSDSAGDALDRSRLLGNDERALVVTTLIPVIELEPGRYATRPHPIPTGSGAEQPDAWRAYWIDSLADSGITGVVSVGGLWCTPIDTLPDEVLRVVIARELADYEPGPDALDTVGALDGGFVLRSAGGTLLPSCCGDLSNIDAWRRAVEDDHDEWRTLWIGHPWVLSRTRGHMLELSHPTGPDTQGPAEPLLVLDRQDLARAIQAADVALVAFRSRVEAAVARTHPTMAAAIARVMVRGHSPES